MQSVSNSTTENPLAGLISDEDFRVLQAHDLLSERAIRDYQMRTTFRRMRRANVPAADALERLRDQYPYLQIDTIRKIVYNAAHTP